MQRGRNNKRTNPSATKEAIRAKTSFNCVGMALVFLNHFWVGALKTSAMPSHKNSLQYISRIISLSQNWGSGISSDPLGKSR